MYKWWQTGLIYEVYVRSFQDSNGDGVGDIRGIISRLDYLQWLGITAIWLGPVYPSPMKDFGYDITDYRGIDPLFGQMKDFDEFLTEVHSRNMKLIMDLVPNHTSDQHHWFLASRSSANDAKRDWYIWRNAKPDGSPPNNWLSVLGGRAWEWDEHSGQYYYHSFLREQPDLNLRNPEVMQEVTAAMRFWLDKGVDGFRVDVMWHLAKDELLRDNPVNPLYQPHMPECDQLLQVYSCDQPGVHAIVKQLRAVIDEYDDRVLCGEIYLPPDKLIAYYGDEGDGAHLPANFQLLFAEWKSDIIAAVVDEYDSILPKDAWPNWVLSNHDRPRLISRVGEEQSRIAALLLLSLRGTPTLYYGDEIGMRNVAIPQEEVQDPQGLNMPEKNLSRDPQRTPMQWDHSQNAGFSNARPWLRLDRNFESLNVSVQSKDKNSMLSFYKRLIDLRQREPSLQWGNYIPVHADQRLMAYLRKAKDSPAFLILLNFSHQPAAFKPLHLSLNGKIVLATELALEGGTIKEEVVMEGNAGMIVQLDDAH